MANFIFPRLTQYMARNYGRLMGLIRAPFLLRTFFREPMALILLILSSSMERYFLELMMANTASKSGKATDLLAVPCFLRIFARAHVPRCLIILLRLIIFCSLPRMMARADRYGGAMALRLEL